MSNENHDRDERPQPPEVHVHVTNVFKIGDGDFGKKIFDALAEIKTEVRRVANKQTAEQISLDSLTERVRGQGTVEDGILVLVQQLVTQANGDPVKLQALADALDTDDAKLKALSDALLAGTGSGGTGTGGTLTVLPGGGISLAVGGTQQLSVDDASGADVTGTSTFESSAPSIAAVSSTGLVTGGSAGSAVITAKSADGSQSGTANVTVA